MKYKRFLVFQYSHYYPSGGFSDFTQKFDTKEEVEKYLIESYECLRGFRRCEKCRELQRASKYENLHQWDDVNIVEDLVGYEDFNGNDFVKNYNKRLDDENDE